METLTAMSADERERLSLALADNLTHFLQNNSMSVESTIFGVYAPLKDEPDWTKSPWLQKLNLAFPRATGKDQMSFYQCKVEDLHLKKEFGVKIMVPPDGSSNVQPDVMLVPGLGFTAQGARLGRGGGFYDRWLAGFRGKKIGLCFEVQLLQELKIEAHDVLMDFIVTEKRILPLPEQTPKGVR